MGKPMTPKSEFCWGKGKELKFGKECFAGKIWDDRKTWCRKRCLSFGVGMQNGNFWVDLDWGCYKLFGDDFSNFCEVGQWREQSPCTTKICAFGSEPWLKSCISSSMAALCPRHDGRDGRDGRSWAGAERGGSWKWSGTISHHNRTINHGHCGGTVGRLDDGSDRRVCKLHIGCGTHMYTLY